jgi:HD-like signal output (HDOD) protein
MATGAMNRPLAPDAEALMAGILKRMNESGGFPALDHSVARIVDALERGDEDTTPLIEAVLADVSLTQKVLRLANSAMYAPIGRNVTTVSQAMSVLGFQAVGHLALGVKLIGSLGQMKSPSRTAERELAHSLVAGSVAGSVVGKAGVAHGETGIVCTLLHRVGQLLTAFYLPEAWSRIRQAMAAGQDEGEAARAELGMTMADLGLRIAEQWRLPPRILHTMEAEVPSAEAAAREDTEDEAWLLALTRFSHRSASVISAADPDARAPRIAALADEYGPALKLQTADLVEAVAAATDEVTAKPFLAEILVEKADDEAAPAADGDPGRQLQAGLAALRRAAAAGLSLPEREARALDLLLKSLALSRVAVLRRDADGPSLRVTTALANKRPSRLQGLVVPTGAGADLVHLALLRKVDIYIDNPRDTKIAARLPDWIRSFSLHPFFLLPFGGEGGKPPGLIYGQQADDAKLDKGLLLQLAELRGLLQAD